MIRRGFLSRVAGGGAALALGGNVWGKTKRHVADVDRFDKRNRISISTWSLRDYFLATRRKDLASPEKMLALLDFSEMVANRYKVHNLEFYAAHFASTEKMYLQELKSRLVRDHSRVVNITVDTEEIRTGGGLSDPSEGVREAAVDAAITWIDIAVAVGSKCIQCDPGQMNPEDLSPTVESYKQLAAHGRPKGVQVIVANPNGTGLKTTEELLRLFKKVGSEMVGALPNFVNFPDEATREKGLAELFPYARVICHVNGFADTAGNETDFDFRKCIEISKSAGFRGIYSVEYEGPGDPYEGIQKTLDELLKYL